MQHYRLTAGTGVHGCVGGDNRLRGQVEILCIWSRDAVPVGDFNFLSVVNIIGIMGQPQPVSQVLLVPVHIVMVISLVTFQSHCLSCHCDLVSCILSVLASTGPVRDRADVIIPKGRLVLRSWEFQGETPPVLTCPQEIQSHTGGVWWPFLAQDRDSCHPALFQGNRTWALGNSLEVQWLGLGAFTARSQFQSLVGELRSQETWDTTKIQKKNLGSR